MGTQQMGAAGRGLLLRALAAVAVFWAGQAAGDVQKQVDELIAALSKEARQPQEMAAKLYHAAAGLEGKRDLQLALYAACYDYAVKSSEGQETISKAAEAALALRPEQPAEWQERLVSAQRLQFAAAKGKDKEDLAARLVASLLRLGDMQIREEQFDGAASSFRGAQGLGRLLKSPAADRAQWSLTVALAGQRVHGDIRMCTARLARDPNDAVGSRKLVELYVTELDTPAKAQAFLNAVSDEAYRRNVPLAGEPVVNLDKAQCRQLGRWYAELAEGPSPMGRPRMLVRAIRYLERFLDLHREQGVELLAARAELNDLRKRLADYPWFGVPGTITGWADDRYALCLNGKEVSRNHANCRSGTPGEVVLKPGDVLCARASDVIYAHRGFRMEFLSDDGKVALSSSPAWRIFKPPDPAKWWEFAANPTDPPSVTAYPNSAIWGDSNPAFLYHVVTAADLNPRP